MSLCALFCAPLQIMSFFYSIKLLISYFFILGSIVTSLGEENNTGPADSIDVVFTTYWQYPAKVRIILPEDKACIEKYRKLHTSKPGNASISSRGE